MFKLNTGLVGIISSFLASGRNDSRLDYKSLTTLSDTSRNEAVHALTQLYQRVSHSSLVLRDPAPACAGCGSSRHAHCERDASPRAGTPNTSGSGQAQTPSRTRRAHERSQSDAIRATSITRVVAKGSAQPQLALVRPRGRRGTSSSSSSSSAASAFSPSLQSRVSTAPTTPNMSPVFPPDLDAFPFPLQKPSPAFERRARSASAPRPVTSDDKPTTPKQAQPAIGTSKKSKLGSQSSRAQSLRRKKATTPPCTTPESPPKVAEPYLLQQVPIQAQSHLLTPRRSQKATPSAYSFLTDSTKLGEIPPHKQTAPPDYELMARLNAEAVASSSGWLTPGSCSEVAKSEPKRGGSWGWGRMWRFWRGKAVAD